MNVSYLNQTQFNTLVGCHLNIKGFHTFFQNPFQELTFILICDICCMSLPFFDVTHTPTYITKVRCLLDSFHPSSTFIVISAKWKPFNHNSLIMCRQRNHLRMRTVQKGCNKIYRTRHKNCFIYYLAKLTLAFCPPLRETPRSPTRVMSPSAKCSIS